MTEVIKEVGGVWWWVVGVIISVSCAAVGVVVINAVLGQCRRLGGARLKIQCLVALVIGVGLLLAAGVALWVVGVIMGWWSSLAVVILGVVGVAFLGDEE